MGMAILAGMGIFIAIDMILGLALYSGYMGGYSLLASPLGGGFGGIIISAAMGAPIMVNGTMLILDIIIPVVCGIIAGVIARGSSGRGFIAGFSGVIIGFFIMFLMSFLVNYLMTSQANYQLITILVGVLVMPIILGILGGIGGGLMSAVLASAAPESSLTPPTTMVIQPSQPLGPVIIGGYQQPQQQQAPSARVICPACKTQNDSVSTFCQSCGTRLRS
jgi:hypothetical protein